ncbi:Protein BRICK 1, partial [Cucurbita argyrosperma subsp. argyrosperma]
MARAGGITNAVNVGIAVQADWENREFISHISINIRRLFDFLVHFGTGISRFLTYFLVPSEATTKSKLASLNEKLDTLERRLEMLEVQVSTASANPSLFTT